MLWDYQATLRKWWKRYQEGGLEGLTSQSRRPHTSPNTKVGNKEEKLTLELRRKRNLGARRIQSELQRLHTISLSLATIPNLQDILNRFSQLGISKADLTALIQDYSDNPESLATRAQVLLRTKE